MTQYRDRCDGYVPEPLSYSSDGLKPTFSALIGRPGGHLPTAEVPVALAQADELNRDRSWWWAQVDPGAAGDRTEHWSQFSGWDVRVGVHLDTWNYRDVNDWKGHDEIRKAGEWLVTFNGAPVYGDSVGADVPETLGRISRVIRDLQSDKIPVDWRRQPYEPQLEGRPVYYRDVPARLGWWMPDQGAIMVQAVAEDFPPRVRHRQPDRHRREPREMKVDIFDPHLWWYRSRPFGDEPAGEDMTRAWRDGRLGPVRVP